jgi:pyruvate dehydrogenase E2 component (dihydrolipoamide acetyltransferase)
MADIVIMPKLGFDMAEGTLVRWVVNEGEQVEKGAILAEIETDKATVEVESSHSGVVHQHLVEEGSSVPIGEPIAVIGEPEEEIDIDQLLGGGKQQVDEVSKPSEKEKEEVRGEISEDAATDGEKLKEEDLSQKDDDKSEEEGAADGRGRLPEDVRASPLARKIAEERNIDIRQVKGSGPDGRIIKKDVEAFEPSKVVDEKKAPMTTVALVEEPREDKIIPLSRLRSIIGRRMAESFQQSPHFFVTQEYDVEALFSLRKQVNSILPEEQKVSVNDFIIKGVALALREFPNLNASLKQDQGEVVQHGSINIGVAVAVENGLLTVVCRNTDIKPLSQIAIEIKNMVNRAREGKVRPEDIEGSTFSVSNLGMFDVDQFTAIINPPEAAILAVGSARQIPVVIDGEVKPAMRMKATISIDHRISDGAEAAQFMQALAKYLEEPLRLLV